MWLLLVAYSFKFSLFILASSKCKCINKKKMAKFFLCFFFVLFTNRNVNRDNVDHDEDIPFLPLHSNNNIGNALFSQLSAQFLLLADFPWGFTSATKVLETWQWRRRAKAVIVSCDLTRKSLSCSPSRVVLYNDLPSRLCYLQSVYIEPSLCWVRTQSG